MSVMSRTSSLRSRSAKPAPKPAAEAKTGTLEIAGKAAAVHSDPLVDQYRRKLSMALF